jgi:peroxiredoxin
MITTNVDERVSPLPSGTRAPDFELRSAPDQTVSLADFEPKSEVARAYRVYRANDGTSERALYVIDADGIVRWSYVSPVGVNPGADGILRVLENLTEVGAS